MNLEEIISTYVGKEISVEESTFSLQNGRSYTSVEAAKNDPVYMGFMNASAGAGFTSVVLFPGDCITADFNLSRVVAHVGKVDGKYIIESIRNG